MGVLKETYTERILPSMVDRFQYKNRMEAPRLVKVVVNMGIGEAKDKAELLDQAIEDIIKITGQRPVVTRAKKSISNFKIRQGMPIGCRVTLRGERMYEFLFKLINVALPRIRDFRGLSPRSFDGRGNYSLGLREQIVFPEISIDEVEKIMGMDITIVTTAETDEEARELLRLMGMPIRT